MKLSTFLKFAMFGISTILLRRRRPILGTIILTDRCNLKCRHCAVNNLTCVDHPYEVILREMRQLFDSGIRILFFCGGETFLWRDGETNRGIRDLVVEAKRMGFDFVNIVTNGTFELDVPEADLILLSLDGDRIHHNEIRGDTYDTILTHIRRATASNLCLYMAINRINQCDLEHVGELAASEPNVRAVSFNFHTPYPGTETLTLSTTEKQNCCDRIGRMMERKIPVFNLKRVFPYLVHRTFPTPCHQCVVLESGHQSLCGRCVDIPGLCEQCGYFFAAEYSLIFHGNIPVILEMLRTYLKYI
ncbi:MAG: radical SAM protein [Planctomycetia bacterium]|nr:radical SAM protein [Planctomycetia bacterium]